ncbi:ThiF family adenylyltransferase [Streptomyces sp. NPDC048508]|uniref:ThiF family adenylyltransferase n=1 Tax=Streptomyces sp. NPDC048508 TaxID=3365561 RepID=UPI00371730FC
MSTRAPELDTERQSLLAKIEDLKFGVDSTSWSPEIFDPCSPDGLLALTELLNSGRVRSVRDNILEQLRELVTARDPQKSWTRENVCSAVDKKLQGKEPAFYGAWIFYPWSNDLVHLLPRDEYRELRSDRNRYKITRTEQNQLLGSYVGIVGLSVGNAAAVTLALEGIGGRFRLADYDSLSLSNLNRLRAGVSQLGINKTVLAAREMFEIDPWLDIEIYSKGLQEDSVDAFISGDSGKLNVVIEECDDIRVKLLVRERSRAQGVPVVMDTSDRGMLDVERFDAEPERALFHGLVGNLKSDDLDNLTERELLSVITKVIDPARLSERAVQSLPEMGVTISGWPQLASGVALGGAIVAETARRILLGQTAKSGRYYVDPAEVLELGPK